MGDTGGTPALLIVLLIIVLLLDWLGTTSLFAESTPVATGSFVDAPAPAPSPQVFVVPTPASSAGNAQSGPLSFTSGNFAYEETSFHYEEEAPRWVHKEE